MGWGASKGAKPQPNPHGAPDADVMSKSRMKRLVHAPSSESETVKVAAGFDDNGDAAVIEMETPSEKPSENAKAQLAWHQLKSKKGWTESTVAMLLYEFIQSRGLFAELVKFTRKR